MKVSSIARSQPQRGVTLIELLVGIVIGLLTIAVAMGALMVYPDTDWVKAVDLARFIAP